MMKRRLFCGMLILLASTGFAAGYSRDEWRVRPWEIINGLKPHSRTLWQLDRNSLKGWMASGGDAALAATSETKLWGETVAKLTFPKGGSVTVKLPQSLKIDDPVDGLDLWIYGPVNNGVGSSPELSFLISDASGRKIKIPAVGMGSRWAKLRWWGMAAAVLPRDVKFPIEVHSFTFARLLTRTPNDFLCFDMLGAFKFPGETRVPDTAKMNLPFPTTPDSIMPIGGAPDGKNTVVKLSGDSYSFQYTGSDGTLCYIYRPVTGTLGDITVKVDKLPEFKIAVVGGVHGEIDGVKFAPGDANIQARLLQSSLKDGGKLFTRWRWSKAGKNLDFQLNFYQKGRSLAVEAAADLPTVTAFDAGYVEGVVKPRLFGLTYLNNRWDYPRLLATDDYFVSVFADWYTSNASDYVEAQGRKELVGAAVISDHAARVLGGTLYFPKTDGQRNLLYERLFLTVSPELSDVLPNIPNPPSPFLKETGRMVCMTRAYALQGRANDVKNELAFWKKMKDYGAEDIWVRFHSAQYRTPLENNHTSLSMDGSMSNGGDATMVELVAGMRKLFRRVAPYNDNRILAANAPQFDYDILSRSASGGFNEGWDACFRPKPAAMLKLMRDFVPGFVAKYHWNAEYLDELTNAPPWADVDYDADAPGAGKFSAVLRDFGAVALQQRELYRGPIWSEGCAAYFWAGLLDTDYAVSNDTNAKLPLIVDFKLRKINPLENYNGADWPIVAGKDVDKLLATEIAEGNIGHLIFRAGDYSEGLPQQGRIEPLLNTGKGMEPLLKSYFMIRQLQELYSGVPVEKIAYDVDGKLMGASQMLRSGRTSQNRIYLKYANGLEIWVNRGESGDWTVNIEGEEYVIPPSGHVAIQLDGITQYSIVKDDRRVDYSSGKLYTYVNAHGKPYAFPEITAANPYLLRKKEGWTQLIPVPFLTSETVKGLDARQAQPLNEDDSPAGPEQRLDVTDGGRADLRIDGKAFSDKLQ